MNAHSAIAAPLSKFAFCDLVLDTALSLEKVRLGGAAEPAALERLAKALSRASKPFATSQPSFVEPTFYDSFERLFRSQRSGTPQSVEQIQAFVEEAVEGLRAIEKGSSSTESISELVDFCVNLHQELSREIEAEEGTVIDEWRTSDISAEDIGS